jgi:hypothetical protein
MKYEIKGIDVAGKDRALLVDADSEQAGGTEAKSMGVYPYAVKLAPVPVFHPQPINTPSARSGNQISCPNCQSLATRGAVPGWQILICIIFFPIGLLALLGGRNPTICPRCGFAWQA